MSSIVNLRDMTDIDFEYTEEEALELEEKSEDSDKELFPITCRKCEDAMPFTRVEKIRVRAYKRMFSGVEEEGMKGVHVCHYCLRDGWRPLQVQTNHNEVSWYNQFDRISSMFTNNLSEFEDDIKERFKEHDDKYDNGVSLLEYGVTPTDIDFEELVDHLKEEYMEFIRCIDNYNFANIEDESLDIGACAFVLYWYAKEIKDDKEEE